MGGGVASVDGVAPTPFPHWIWRGRREGGSRRPERRRARGAAAGEERERGDARGRGDPGGRGAGRDGRAGGGLKRCVEARGSLKHGSLDGVEAFKTEISTLNFHEGSFLGTNLWVHKDPAPQRGQICWVALGKKTSCLMG